MLLITHNANFHQDDLFAVATLLLLFPDLEVKRTRNLEEIKKADFVVDTGGIYDATINRFDHHQMGGAGKRENGIPYASFGLVWKHYGAQLCGNEAVADVVDKKMVQPIDAADCGYEMFHTTKKGLMPYFFGTVLKALTPTWRDQENVDDVFMSLQPIAQLILQKEIQKAHYFFQDIQEVKDTYKRTEDKRIVVLDHPMAWKSILSQKKEPMFVVHPDNNTGEWVIACVIKNPRAHEYRKLLPKSWSAKKGAELEKVTGIKDAEFCHMKRFIGKAWTKEAAVAMAHLALESE